MIDPRAEAEKSAASFRGVVDDFGKALDLLNGMVNMEPCSLDEHGSCVQHSYYLKGAFECPHARARRMLNEYAKFWLA